MADHWHSTAERGTCPVCGRDDITITKRGMVRVHGAKDGAWPPMNCAGSGRPPKEGRHG